MSNIKPTNPKDAIGSTKIPMHLFPPSAIVHGVLGLLDGMFKYGKQNYRAIGVRSSIYYDAARRHLDAWMEGEDYASDSGVHHLGHALACIAILLDCIENGNLNDDRYYPSNYRAMIDRLTPEVERLRKLYEDRNPHHYTIQDTGKEIVDPVQAELGEQSSLPHTEPDIPKSPADSIKQGLTEAIDFFEGTPFKSVKQDRVKEWPSPPDETALRWCPGCGLSHPLCVCPVREINEEGPAPKLGEQIGRVVDIKENDDNSLVFTVETAHEDAAGAIQNSSEGDDKGVAGKIEPCPTSVDEVDDNERSLRELGVPPHVIKYIIQLEIDREKLLQSVSVRTKDKLAAEEKTREFQRQVNSQADYIKDLIDEKYGALELLAKTLIANRDLCRQVEGLQDALDNIRGDEREEW